MDLLFLLFAVIVVAGGIVSLRRRARGWDARLDREPWAASLKEEEDEDDEPLDEEAIRRAEDAFLEEEWDRPDS